MTERRAFGAFADEIIFEFLTFSDPQLGQISCNFLPKNPKHKNPKHKLWLEAYGSGRPFGSRLILLEAYAWDCSKLMLWTARSLCFGTTLRTHSDNALERVRDALEGVLDALESVRDALETVLDALESVLDALESVPDAL